MIYKYISSKSSLSNRFFLTRFGPSLGNHFFLMRFGTGNHFFLTRFGPGNHFSLTRFGTGNHFFLPVLDRVTVFSWRGLDRVTIFSWRLLREMGKKWWKRANLGHKMTFLEKTNMLMMFRALKYTIYEKIALGDRIPLTFHHSFPITYFLWATFRRWHRFFWTKKKGASLENI